MVRTHLSHPTCSQAAKASAVHHRDLRFSHANLRLTSEQRLHHVCSSIKIQSTGFYLSLCPVQTTSRWTDVSRIRSARWDGRWRTKMKKRVTSCESVRNVRNHIHQSCRKSEAKNIFLSVWARHGRCRWRCGSTSRFAFYGLGFLAQTRSWVCSGAAVGLSGDGGETFAPGSTWRSHTFVVDRRSLDYYNLYRMYRQSSRVGLDILYAKIQSSRQISTSYSKYCFRCLLLSSISPGTT